MIRSLRGLLAATAALCALASTAYADITIKDANGNPVTLHTDANGYVIQGQASEITAPTATLTVNTASAYSANWVLGGVASLTVPSSGFVQNGVVTFNSGGAYTGGLDLLLLSGSPTGGGVTDHAALALTGTDTGKIIGWLHTTDCKALSATVSACQVQNASQTFVVSGTTLYIVPVLGAATSTAFSSASDVVIRFGPFQ